MKRKKGYFSISAVAKMFSIHQQTIRLYEKEGLIAPKRSEGNTRLFSEEDVNRLEEVIYLTHKLGINLAGVDMILRLQKQIKKMQKEMNILFKNAQNELTKESEMSKNILKSTVTRLAALKSESMLPMTQQTEAFASQENKQSLLVFPEPTLPLIEKKRTRVVKSKKSE
jgi:MerR family transcriptional regulator, heat shock protein HspR